MDYHNNKYVRIANALKEQNLYPYFRPIKESNAKDITVNGKKLIMIGSNNYLGLTHHPLVIEKTVQAIKKYGTGCTGSRFLNGNFCIHEKLENQLAEFVGYEKALVFSTGMQTNLGSISSLLGPRDLFISDGENHASIVDGLRMSLSTTLKYKTGNMAELEAILQQNVNKYQNMIIVTDGIFSMTGQIAKLPEIEKIASKYGAKIYLDDAHGFGVLGDQGQGTANHFKLTSKISFYMSTFSKSFASIGGFIASDAQSIDYLKHNSRTFMFSAAPPPSAVATVLACLETIKAEPEILRRLRENADYMKNGLTQLGFNTLESQTPIIPILVKDTMLAMKITRFLFDHGIFATPVIPPATPPRMALIRTSYSASHTKEDLQYCLDIFNKVSETFPQVINTQHKEKQSNISPISKKVSANDLPNSRGQ